MQLAERRGIAGAWGGRGLARRSKNGREGRHLNGVVPTSGLRPRSSAAHCRTPACVLRRNGQRAAEQAWSLWRSVRAQKLATEFCRMRHLQFRGWMRQAMSLSVAQLPLILQLWSLATRTRRFLAVFGRPGAPRSGQPSPHRPANTRQAGSQRHGHLS